MLRLTHNIIATGIFSQISSQIDSVVKQLEQLNIKLSEKDLSKLSKLSTQDGKIPKYCYSDFAMISS